MRNYTSDRRPASNGKPFKKKNRKNGFRQAGQGQQQPRNLGQQQPRNGATGLCQKCGQPAPDGKLCLFHRNLLNSLRDGFR
jgi:hypothetical protein